LDVVSRIQASDIAPMSGNEIDAEVKAVRANLRQQSAMTAGGGADRS
jgi:hypothetical protein